MTKTIFIHDSASATLEPIAVQHSASRPVMSRKKETKKRSTICINP